MTLTDVISKRNVFGKVGYLEDLSIKNPSGGGRIEVGGNGASYIDIKNPYSDDYDVRLGVENSGTSARLESGGNQNLDIYAGTGNLTLQSFGGGKVGIGTQIPASLLHINGVNNITLTNPSNDVGERGMRVSFDAVPARLTVQKASDSGAFEANLVAIMQDTGNVGINTITPQANLHVNGTVRLQGLPTSAAGLSPGDIWNNSGTLRIA